MKPADIERLLISLVDDLAAIEHQRWSHWQRYMHGKAQRQSDGSLLVPAELVTRWEKQIAMDFAELNDEEKESDREQVRRYLPLIARALTGRAGLD